MVLVERREVSYSFPDFEPVAAKDKFGNDCLIRKYEHGKDREKLIEMYLSFDHSQRCLGLPPVSKEGIERWIDYLAKSGFGIVAEVDGRIVGHLVIVPTEDGKNVDLTIFVHQDFQNKGIGQLLMNLIIDYCKRAGFEGITLVTERTNSRAIHVYKKLGFKIVAPYYECDMYLSLKE